MHANKCGATILLIPGAFGNQAYLFQNNRRLSNSKKCVSIAGPGIFIIYLYFLYILHILQSMVLITFVALMGFVVSILSMVSRFVGFVISIRFVVSISSWSL